MDAISVAGHLPLPCPRCGHRRLLPTILADPPPARVVAVACEACETAWPGVEVAE